MIGERVSHYRVVEKIGEGKKGTVYRAWDERLHRDVAIRVFSEGSYLFGGALERFRLLVNHPNIQSIHEFDIHDGTYYLVMEYVPGSTLTDKLRQGPLPEKEVVWLGAQLAEGLAAAHEQGVIHSHLSPGNLRITPEGQLKILDFGLGYPWQAGSGETQEQPSGETLAYLSPEQLRGEPAHPGSDIYAVGAVLYEMATGQRAFREAERAPLVDAVLSRLVAPPRLIKPRLSPELDRIILKCLEKEAGNRYRSAKEIARTLGRLAGARGSVLVGDPAVLAELARAEALERAAIRVDREIRRALAPLKKKLRVLIMKRDRLLYTALVARKRFFQVAKKMDPRLLEHRSLRSERKGKKLYVVWDDIGPQFSTDPSAEPPQLRPFIRRRRGRRAEDVFFRLR